MKIISLPLHAFATLFEESPRNATVRAHPAAYEGITEMVSQIPQ